MRIAKNCEVKHMPDTDPRMQYRRQTAGKMPHVVSVREMTFAEWPLADTMAPKEGYPTIVSDKTTDYILWRQLRYGENPGQAAAVYTTGGKAPFDILQEHPEKTLSYTNVMNADAALRLVWRVNSVFPNDKIAAVVKHTGPSGVARYATAAEAYEKAWNCDPEAAFGSVDGLSHEVDEDTARLIVTKPFVEAVIAPGYTDKARELLERKPKLRVLQAKQQPAHMFTYRPIDGGYLGQERFVSRIDSVDNFEVVSHRQPTAEQLEAALFNWQIVPFVISNAIVVGRERYASAIVGGQPHRNRSLRWAIENVKYVNKFDNEVLGTVVASDAFFPFPDSVRDAQEAGASALIAPLGSERDKEVIAEANRRHVLFLAPFYIDEEGKKIYERAFSH